MIHVTDRVEEALRDACNCNGVCALGKQNKSCFNYFGMSTDEWCDGCLSVELNLTLRGRRPPGKE